VVVKSTSDIVGTASMAGCAACIARRCCLAHGGYYERRQPWLPLSGFQPTMDNIPIANCKKGGKG